MGSGHSGDTLRLGTLGRLWVGPLGGGTGAGHSGDTLGWAPRETLGFLGLDTLELGTPGKVWGWALQGWARSRLGEEKSSGRGEFKSSGQREELSLTSNNPTQRAGERKIERESHIAREKKQREREREREKDL